MNFTAGSLVMARGREWVVLPESEGELLMVRPLGGAVEEATGIYLPLETVETARFELPNPEYVGDYRSCRLLRDALRLGLRSGTGPFRSFARIGVEPRPYQLVPLLMALQMDTVRLLVADDVGVGKTIEAGLVARELLDRGIARRLAVICPPHLVEQWREELWWKFNIEACAVTAASATALERNCKTDETLFDIYPYVVVSLDFIKTDKRRDDFKRTCPELVIVDEAHTCAFGTAGRGRQQRHELVKGLAENPGRHMILLTATPHSGNENAFRSLLGILDPQLETLLDQTASGTQEKYLRRLSGFLVQRRREDIRLFMEAETAFPERVALEEGYTLSEGYLRLLERAIKYVRSMLTEPGGSKHGQRIRWWSALALLRSLASSPAAAAATLRTRAAAAESLDAEEADHIGRRFIMDMDPDSAEDAADITPGAIVETMPGETDETGEVNEPTTDTGGLPHANRRVLADMAKQAEKLAGKHDFKLQCLLKILEDLPIHKPGTSHFRPVIFCRFIHTAEYLARELREALPDEVAVTAVTGAIPAVEREKRVYTLAKSEHRVLVATDCLSEGINLQEFFDAVIHYDLSWNPTRHEQREGRVDRFGQVAGVVKTITLYGIDNRIDGIVLDVLIRKHKAIREALKVSIPVPADSDQVVEAIFEGLLFRENSAGGGMNYLPGFEEYFRPNKEKLYKEWDRVGKEEKKWRKRFTQPKVKVDDVARELAAVRDAVGTGIDVEAFFRDALVAHGAGVTGKRFPVVHASNAPDQMKDILGDEETLRYCFNPPCPRGALYLHRTHPMVEKLAHFVSDAALDRPDNAVAKRCGVIRTPAVKRRTTLLLMRLRFHMTHTDRRDDRPILAEECRIFAFAGAPDNAQWLTDEQADTLLNAEPGGNIHPQMARGFLEKILDDYPLLLPHLEEQALQRAHRLKEDHCRVAGAVGGKNTRITVTPLLPPDVMGVYVYMPTEGVV